MNFSMYSIQIFDLCNESLVRWWFDWNLAGECILSTCMCVQQLALLSSHLAGECILSTCICVQQLALLSSHLFVVHNCTYWLLCFATFFNFSLHFSYYCHIVFDKMHWLNLVEPRIQKVVRGLEGFSRNSVVQFIIEKIMKQACAYHWICKYELF